MTPKLGSKKGQITAFIVIGILILALAGIFFASSGKPQVERAEQQASSALNQLQRKPLVDYITLCLEETTSQAIRLIAGNGGFISPESFMQTDQYRVHYGLVAFESREPEFSQDDGAYTFGKETVFEKGGVGHPQYPFGKTNLPPLCQPGGPNDVATIVYANPCPAGSYGPRSIQEQLTRYIRQHLTSCINVENKQRIKDVTGFEVTAEEPEVTLILGEQDVTVTARYPLQIAGEQQKTQVADFSKKLPIRLKRVYGFASDVLKADRLLLDFNISKPGHYGRSKYNDSGLSVQISNPLNETPNSPQQFDDLVSIVDGGSVVEAQALLFNTVRVNRKPVLRWIKDDPIVGPIDPFETDLVVPIVGGSGQLVIEVIAFDPDEDELTMTIKGWGFDDTGKMIKEPEPVGQPPEEDCPKDIAFYQDQGDGFNYLMETCMILEAPPDSIWQRETDEAFASSYLKLTHPLIEEDFGYHTLDIKVCDPEGLCDSQTVRILIVDQIAP